MPSYLWRSLLACKDLLKEGMAWRIGNGKKVNIWTDCWIGVSALRCLEMDDNRTTVVGRVENLIDHQTGIWKSEMINECFTQADATSILTIPISSISREDRRIWKLTKHGFFMVKSAYHLAVYKFPEIHKDRPSSSVTPND